LFLCIFGSTLARVHMRPPGLRKNNNGPGRRSALCRAV
jgi:hypothetical protein